VLCVTVFLPPSASATGFHQQVDGPTLLTCYNGGAVADATALKRGKENESWRL